MLYDLFKRTIESFALYFVICMILSDITIYCILLCWSVFENSFPPTARPTLWYIWPSFGQRSPLRLPHSGQISHIILDISSPRSLNCDAYHALWVYLTESVFQTRFKFWSDTFICAEYQNKLNILRCSAVLHKYLIFYFKYQFFLFLWIVYVKII